MPLSTLCMTNALTPFRSLLEQTHDIVLKHRDQQRAYHLESAPRFSPFHFIKWGEVPVTHMLAYFLDPQQSHGQQAVFQHRFVAAVQARLPQRFIPEGGYSVVAEKRHGGGTFGQIDLLLTCPQPRYALCIENKPHPGTADQWRQLEAYHEFLTGKGRFGDNYLLVYLSDRERNPHESSLEPTKREDLKESGHYLNLTYETFLLPLLSEWAGLAQPEKVKHFLLDFRHQVERQLNFPSTAPTPAMYQDEIVNLLLKDVSLLQAAYELPNAIKAAETRLKEQLAADVLKLAHELQLSVTSSPEQWAGFKNFTNEVPCWLSKQTEPTWGPCCIGLEFSGPSLYVGVIGGGKSSPIGQELMKRLGDTHGNENWACWVTLYDTDWKSLYADVATGEFVTKLRPRLAALCQTLDAMQQEGLLTS